MKKIVTIILVTLLLASMVFTGAMAQGGPGGPQGGGRNGQQSGNPQGGNSNGTGPQGADQNSQGQNGRDQNGQEQGDPSRMGGPNGQGGHVDADAIADAIAELTDADTATSLTALLDAYQTAAAGTDETATQTALKALMEGLSNADVKVQGAGGQPQDRQGGKINTDAIADAIAGLTDADTVTSLTALLDAYQTAAAGTDETATQTALKALLDALADANVQVQGADNMGGGHPLGQRYGRFLDTDRIESAISDLSATDSDTAASLTSLLTTYETAAAGTDDEATRTALKALLDGLANANLDVADADQGGNHPENRRFDAESGKYLDAEKVSAAIATLSDTDAATTLTTLLTAYETAAAGQDDTATRSAFTALMDALAAAGLSLEPTT